MTLDQPFHRNRFLKNCIKFTLQFSQANKNAKPSIHQILLCLCLEVHVITFIIIIGYLEVIVIIIIMSTWLTRIIKKISNLDEGYIIADNSSHEQTIRKSNRLLTSTQYTQKDLLCITHYYYIVRVIFYYWQY